MDTHILAWMLLSPEKLSHKTKKVIEEAQKNHQLLISVVTLWEIAMLIQKKRLSTLIPLKSFLENIEALPGLHIEPLNSDIIAESVLLPDLLHADPFDRLIVATARCLNSTLLTKDGKILEWANKGYLKTHFCDR